jgi:hypothetical protein
MLAFLALRVFIFNFWAFRDCLIKHVCAPPHNHSFDIQKSMSMILKREKMTFTPWAAHSCICRQSNPQYPCL